MARIALTLRAEFRPAYYALLDAAQCIADTHGEEAAADWASAQLSEHFDLFCRLRADERPQLRLIAGGKA